MIEHAGADVDGAVGLQEVVRTVLFEVRDHPVDEGARHEVCDDLLVAADGEGAAVGDGAVDRDGAHLRGDVAGRATRAQVHQVTVRARGGDRDRRRGRHLGPVFEDRPVDVDEDDAAAGRGYRRGAHGIHSPRCA
ncbi:hypothetical protein JOE53_002384 [Microbacterium laevaniformans]|nr:hypothetical protein [Microbacterium laevaniformans]